MSIYLIFFSKKVNFFRKFCQCRSEQL